jgi:hypothetical protein
VSEVARDHGGGAIEGFDGFEQPAMLPLIGGHAIAALANRAAQPL